ncbi:MAG TPA: 3'-5' exonuclease [Candidatus Acidoferrum sp.]|nr:3'-5' exonuclease [Candidatus Acidoferrum sp.]
MAQLSLLSLDEFLAVSRGFILLDLEFTCWDNSLHDGWSDPDRPPEVIEIAAAMYDVASDSIQDHFTSFVRPQKNPILSTYCKSLLSIRQADVDQAPPLSSIVAQVDNWRTVHDAVDTPTCSWGSNDRLFLARDARRSNCQDPFEGCGHVDLRSLFREELGFPPDAPCDRDCLRATLGLLPNLRRHRALDDTLDLAQFCRRLREHRASLVLKHGGGSFP